MAISNFLTPKLKYYLVLVDHFTRYTWLFLLTAKAQVKAIFLQFKPLVKNRFKTKIQNLYSDNVGEFLALRPYLSSQGISHLTTPEHNTLSERKHRHTVETGLALLSTVNMPLTFWPQAFAKSVFLINHLTTPVLDYESPFQKFFQTTPNYGKLRTFGCLCYPWLRPYAPTSYRVYTSRHVRFNETSFPYKQLLNLTPISQPKTSSQYQPYHPHTNIHPTPLRVQSLPLATSSLPMRWETSPTETTATPATENEPALNPEPVTTTETPAQNQATVPPLEPQAPALQHSMTTRSRNNIFEPVSKYNHMVSLQDDPHWIPTTWQQAMKHPKWRAAMLAEFNSQVQNHTLDLEDACEGMNVVGCHWIFPIKYRLDESIKRYKARLVAKGYHHQRGIDFTDTFSSVIKPTTIRIVLGLGVNNSWPLKQIDVNTAFLKGHLKEEVFISQPTGFIDTDIQTMSFTESVVWSQTSASRLVFRTTGFYDSLSDTSLFILKKGKDFVYLLVYVDDILVTGTSTILVQGVIDTLARRFSIKDIGNLSYFLGIEAIRTADGMHLMQQKYVTDFLTKTNMLHSKPVSTPMASSPKLTLRSGSPLSDPRKYRQIVGGLQYLSLTRPENSCAVNKLSQFMHQPSTDHWLAVQRLLRYLSGTLCHGIYLRKQTQSPLHGFSDADWTGDSDDYVSTKGHIIYLGSHSISWFSKKQKGVLYSLNLESSCLQLSSSTVTILVQLTFAKIESFTCG